MAQLNYSQKVANVLDQAQTVYKKSNEVYKDNFRTVGKLMVALFPEGVPNLDDEADFNRWHIFELIIVKLTRYVQNWNAGGHVDSIDDMIVYLGMLQILDEEFRNKEGLDVKGASKHYAPQEIRSNTLYNDGEQYAPQGFSADLLYTDTQFNGEHGVEEVGEQIRTQQKRIGLRPLRDNPQA